MKNLVGSRKVLLIAITLTVTMSVSAFAACPILWQQVAENNDSGSGTRVSASYYYTNVSGLCDQDPNDTDYIFVFKGNFYNCDPDKIRYDNGSWLANADLKIFRPVLSDDDVHLCMGPDTLSWLYGNSVQNVLSGLKLYKLP